MVGGRRGYSQKRLLLVFKKLQVAFMMRSACVVYLILSDIQVVDVPPKNAISAARNFMPCWNK